MAITFTSATDSTSVTVNDTSHGAIAGDFVTFSNANTGNSSLNTQLNNEFSVTSVTECNASPGIKKVSFAFILIFCL